MELKLRSKKVNSRISWDFFYLDKHLADKFNSFCLLFTCFAASQITVISSQNIRGLFKHLLLLHSCLKSAFSQLTSVRSNDKMELVKSKPVCMFLCVQGSGWGHVFHSPQSCSSNPSSQSVCPSHTVCRGIHEPSLHLNSSCSWQAGREWPTAPEQTVPRYWAECQSLIQLVKDITNDSIMRTY